MNDEQGVRVIPCDEGPARVVTAREPVEDGQAAVLDLTGVSPVPAGETLVFRYEVIRPIPWTSG